MRKCIALWAAMLIVALLALGVAACEAGHDTPRYKIVYTNPSGEVCTSYTNDVYTRGGSAWEFRDCETRKYMLVPVVGTTIEEQ